MKNSVLLKIGILLLSYAWTGENLECQVTHNVAPIEYPQIAEIEKIQSFFYFFEQRVNVHDVNLGQIFFDSLIQVGQDTITRTILHNDLLEYFSYGGLIDSILLEDYRQKPVGFSPFFDILEVTPIRALTVFSVDDTVTCVLTVQISNTDTVISTNVLIKKIDDRNTLPVTSYTIVSAEASFLSSIADFALGYIINFVGVNGSIPEEMKAANWSQQWDFSLDDPKICETTLSNYNFVDDALMNVPIIVQTGQGNYSFNEITKEVANTRIERDLIGGIDNFFAYTRTNTDNSYLFVCDDRYNRFLTLGLYGGLITSMPGSCDGQSWGWRFDNLTHASYNRRESFLTTYELSDGAIRLFHFNPDSLSLFEYYSTLMSISDSSRLKEFTLALTKAPYVNPVGREWALWVSEMYNFMPMLNIYCFYVSGNHANKKFIGWKSECDTIKFVSPPAFCMTEIYQPKTNETRLSYDRCEHIMVTDGNHIAVSNADEATNNDSTFVLFQPLWLYKFTTFNSTRMALERTVDGLFYAVDCRNNLIHVFEPFDGRYLYSTRPPLVDDGDGSMLMLKNVKRDWLYPDPEYEDLYIARKWTHETGISRYLPTAKIYNPHVTSQAGDYTRLIFTTTNRTKFRITLVDSLSNELQILGPIFTNAGINKISVYNPNQESIAIYTEPASNTGYGNYMLSESRVVLQDGVPPKSRSGSIVSRLSSWTLNLWPTRVIDKYNIEIRSTVEASMIMELYNSSGDLLTRDEIMVRKGTNLFSKTLSNVLPAGVYFVKVISARNSETVKFVRY